MSVARRTRKVLDYGLGAVVVLCGLVTLWMWTEAILWWGDALALANALAWTALTVIVVLIVAGIEWLQNRGD